MRPPEGRTTPLQLNTATPQHLRSVGTAAKTGGFFHTQKPFSKPQEAAESEGYMAFFNSAVGVLQTLVIALGAGLLSRTDKGKGGVGRGVGSSNV